MAVGCPRKGDSTGPAKVGRADKNDAMLATEVERAITATTALSSELGLVVSEARIVGNSNKLGLRLLPCDVFARVAFSGQEAFQFEIEIARRLTEIGSPVASLDTRVEPRVFERDGFAFTLWRHYEQPGIDPSAASYAKALEGLHAGMAQLDVVAPHFSDRVSEAQRLLRSHDRTRRLEDTDRELLLETLRSCGSRIYERSSREQLLHGEPHPGNVLSTAAGLLFIDFETCCRGPVEFDLAHVPEAVCEAYSAADPELIQESRRLVLAMVAAWRWDTDDQFPSGARAGRALLRALRAGPPWPTLDVVMNQET
jgi:aminoglycoside phosphotransferase (APT) family kinase protein